MAPIEELLSKVDALRAEGKLPNGVTREERISFVYGNCKLSNPDVTREMVEAAVDGVPHLGSPGLPPPPSRTVSGKAFALAGSPFSEDVEVERGCGGVDGRPVLCIQPMTHGDARYAEGRDTGRREGFLESVAIMRAAADGLVQAGGPILATVADGLRHVARQIESSVARSGEP